jgi:hypothetical protein
MEDETTASIDRHPGAGLPSATEPSDGCEPSTSVAPGILIGYARCSTEKQDLAAQRHALRQLGVSDDRLYLDHGEAVADRDPASNKPSPPSDRATRS